MATVSVDDSSLRAQAGWLGLRDSSHFTLFYIYQMNWVNSRNDHHDDSTINVVPSISFFLLVLKSVHLLKW